VSASDDPAQSLESKKKSVSARSINDVAIAPDSQRVAWVTDSGIFIESLTASATEPKRLGPGSDIAWSPDSRQLAFLSNDKSNRQQLYVASVESGTPKRLTTLKGDFSNPQWSPDGKTIAFLFVAGALRRPGAGVPIPTPVGVVGEKPFEQRLAVINVTSGKVNFASPADLYVYEYDWSPDSRQLVATASVGAGDDNWYVAQLYTFNLLSGKAEVIFKPEKQITAPRWSPDGKQIAFIAGVMSGNLGGNSGDVYSIAPEGGPARDLTPQLQASAHNLDWRSAGQILFREYVDGEIGLAEVTLAGDVTQLWRGPEFSPAGTWLEKISLAADGKTSAVVLQSLDHAPEVWAGEIGAWKRISSINQQVHLVAHKTESIHWDNDNWSIQGWITYPHDYDASKRYPMVVDVHGGPSGMSTACCDAELANAGYFVFCPNFRGSAGFGQKFQSANFRDFGYGDLRDILTGIDTILERLPVDKDRIGITGQSYGGYMAMWAVTQTDRFHASVANAGIADWLSYMGQANIPQWVMPYFGVSIFDDPAPYARTSPMNYIKNVKTPTLIVVGAEDGDCPAAQSLEYWYALKSLGVRTQLVIYPNEGHEMTDPGHLRDVHERTLAWFDQFLSPAPKGTAAPQQPGAALVSRPPQLYTSK
jgi:dipeptidyl aminopeptidase/acylaminoacyl peptidase